MKVETKFSHDDKVKVRHIDMTTGNEDYKYGEIDYIVIEKTRVRYGIRACTYKDVLTIVAREEDLEATKDTE